MSQNIKNQSTSTNEGNVLTIKTVQIAPFRTLMTALKDILLETYYFSSFILGCAKFRVL
jgi:hypothetical protein